MKSKLCASAILALAMAMGIGTSSVLADVNSRYFIDVNANSYGWAAEAVDCLWENDIASGIGDNKFAPASEIKRCDFVVLLDRTFNFIPFNSYVAGFSDVSEDAYYHTAVVNAKGHDIISNDYVFYPEQPITRGDAMVMLYKALDLQGYVKNNISTDLSMYSDAYEIRDIKTQIALASLTKMGIISGSDGKIMFTSTMSRAEMAMVFYKAIDYMENNQPQAETPAEDEETKTDAESPETNEKDSAIADENLKTTVTVDGDEVTAIYDSQIRVDKAGENSVVVNEGVEAEISDSIIHSTGDSSAAVVAMEGSNVTIAESTIYAEGKDSYGISGNDGSTVIVDGGKLSAEEEKAAVVKSEGSVEINNAEIDVENSAAVIAADDAEITLDGCTITATGNDGLFRSVVGNDKEADNASEIVIKNSEITGDSKTVLFYANGNDLDATLENCTIEEVDKLIDSTFSASAKHHQGNDIEITLVNQKLEANVICDEKSRLIINLKEGSHLIASIDEMNFAEYIEINVEDGSTLELMSNSYIDVLNCEDMSDVKENGYIIYYNTEYDENDWLDEDEYPLTNGGYMMPY